MTTLTDPGAKRAVDDLMGRLVEAWERGDGTAYGAMFAEDAQYVTEAVGGSGAVREVVELLLKAQGRWHSILDPSEIAGK